MSTEPTFNGKTISDEEFDAMADDVVSNPPNFSSKPRKRGRPALGDGPSRVAQVRMSPADYEAVTEAARSRGESMSEFLRRTAIEAASVTN